MAESAEQWGAISKMAAAAGCQRSHLSRVISGKVHLTPEQADGLAEYWRLNEAEGEYFLYLLEFARAGTKGLRQRIQRKIQRLKKEQEDLSERLRQPSLGVEEREIVYYSAWHWSAIHIIVSIPEYQTVTSISRRLTMPETLVRYCLEQLERFGLVRREGERWKFSSHTIHLPRRSPLIGTHHNNWRARASLKSHDPGSDGVHYTVVQSVSQRDYLKIKELLLAVIDDYSKIAAPSKEEELISFSCDVFRV